MNEAPVVTIVRASGGPPVASGVLVAANRGDKEPFGKKPFSAALFSPWPDSLGQNEPFALHIPESGEWLSPKLVEILALPENAGLRSLAAVTFESGHPLPSHIPDGRLAQGQNLQNLIEQLAVLPDSHGTWLDAWESQNESVLKPLRELAHGSQGQGPTPASFTAEVTRLPFTRSIALMADGNNSATGSNNLLSGGNYSLICRLILRD
jgi:hypothetical protein